ncbi:NUDIX domain-containing protein [Oceanobacillus jeddahense]|uniref:NUDIX domain-containing protein n=1 Tax=Oceanobacillus jeddahense TaxID=1462527 RepID=UPI001FCC649C|nr:NUDIX domain-containing protein [Oceanobacillus jeddahense]
MTENEYNKELQKQVDRAKKDSAKSREKRLNKAEKKPDKLIVNSTQYKRNPDVITEVLERADGVCEKCKKPAPFIRAYDLTPYLEVHHKKPLAEGGEDTVENAIALCPNCHREDHHAVKVTTITVGIIVEEDKVLIVQRKGNNSLPGKWCFPGGKARKGETLERGLRRELYEKFGISIRIDSYFGESIYRTNSGIIRLMSYLVKRTPEDFKINVHKGIDFVKIKDLHKYDFLSAENSIVEKLKEYRHSSLKNQEESL